MKNNIIYVGLIVFLIPIQSKAQTPSEYICNTFEGELSERINTNDFMGETYKCTVKEQWDMQISSTINTLVLEDDHFRRGKSWKRYYVDPTTYNRRAFVFEADEMFIVNVYIPYEQKTNHFYIAQ